MLWERVSAPDRTMDRDHRLDPDGLRPNRRTLKGRVSSGLFRASLCWQAAETKEAHGGAGKLWDMNHLGEPQSAAGIPVLFLAIGLGELGRLGWMLLSGK